MAKRKNPQPHGVRGFSRGYHATPRDLENWSQETGEIFLLTPCKRRHDLNSYGIMKGNVWYTLTGFKKKRRNGKVVRQNIYTPVYKTLWEFKTNRKLTEGGKLKRLCKTQGCLNWEHYEEVKPLDLDSLEIL
jgi:hypothetical protein